jgi:hypothetical protein
VNFPFGTCVDHVNRTFAIWARQLRRCSEQTANKRAFAVNLATVLAQVDAVVIRQRGIVLRIGLYRQSGDFFRRSRDRATTIMTTDNAFERWDALPEIFDFFAVRSQTSMPSWNLQPVFKVRS